MRIRLICEGRTKDAHLRALQADYRKRLSYFSPVVVEELEPLRRRGGIKKLTPEERKLLEKLKGAVKVVLDPRGQEWSSEELAAWIGRRALSGTRELAFLVGGADGFSAALRDQADVLLSLSRLTLTHDWARTLLLEQLYRGFATLRGYPYPR
jgi:23S rRNA (pseudouridine1915-N3)-methyltransferase